MKYKLIKDQFGNLDSVKLIRNDNSFLWIPFDEGNRDYQEYLKWVEEGNTPEPADE